MSYSSGTTSRSSSSSGSNMDENVKDDQDEDDNQKSTGGLVVNLLELATATLSCTMEASMAIRQMAHKTSTSTAAATTPIMNRREKQDGSIVTDADGLAQALIVQAVEQVHPHIRIVGEESAEEMKRNHHHIATHSMMNSNNDNNESSSFSYFQEEILQRYKTNVLSQHENKQNKDDNNNDNSNAIISSIHANVQDVSVIVDPLDGTSSYARGDYDSVSILIAIVLHNTTPIFGIIGKPFGDYNENNDEDDSCVIYYGGSLLNGVFVAGGGPQIHPKPIALHSSLPKAVISTSRSTGIVEDFCLYLGNQGYIDKEPMLVSGAGEKSLRLILQRHNEALWFFPKPGTSRWDVAAPDALLRVLGGKLTNKYGETLDYSKDRDDAGNDEGIVACIDSALHAQCIELFREWEKTRKNDE